MIFCIYEHGQTLKIEDGGVPGIPGGSPQGSQGGRWGADGGPQGPMGLGAPGPVRLGPARVGPGNENYLIRSLP